MALSASARPRGNYIARFMYDSDTRELGSMFCGEGWYIFRRDIPDPPNSTRLCLAYVRNRAVAWHIRDALNSDASATP